MCMVLPRSRSSKRMGFSAGQMSRSQKAKLKKSAEMLQVRFGKKDSLDIALEVV